MARSLRGCWLVALFMIMYGCAPISTWTPRPSPTVAPLVEGHCPRDGDGLVPPADGGLAPAGFVATGVIRCLVDSPLTRKDGRLVYTVRELSGELSPELATALTLPDDGPRSWIEVCPARGFIAIQLLLLDAGGQGYWPRIPNTWCSEPRTEVYEAVDAIAWRDVDSFEVVRKP